MSRDTTGSKWRTALDAVTQEQREEAAAQMGHWPREFWDKWDDERKSLLARYSDLDNSDAQWIAWTRVRVAVKLSEKKS